MRFKKFGSIFIFLFMFTAIAFAGEEKELDLPIENDHWFGLKAETLFPLYVGIGPRLFVAPKWETSLLVGFTPKAYYQTIGTMAANFSGNAAYKDVLEAAFQNNSLTRLDLTYQFADHQAGWGLGSAVSRLHASGRAEIDSVLAAGTGNVFTGLINLLIAAGKDTKVDMDTTINIGEVFCTYRWNSSSRLIVTGIFGIAKVLSANVAIKTDLPNFESSNSGKKLISNTEADIEDIIVRYGLSPTVGAQLSYLF